MSYWRTDPYEWSKKNLYEGPYPTPESAEKYAAKIRAVHLDKFTVIPVTGGYGVEQDVADG